MSASVKPANVDDHRRVVLPETFPPHSTVTFQQIDEDTVVIKRGRAETDVVFIAIERISRLPDDPEWEKKEAAFAEHAAKQVPPPEF